MLKIAAILFIITFVPFLCNGQSDAFNKTYQTDSLLDFKNFFELNPLEQQLDSLFIKNPARGSFRDNRGRAHLDEFRNEQQLQKDSMLSGGMPMICKCQLWKDTLTVILNVGFSGRLGFRLKIYGNEFKSDYFTLLKDIKPFKYKRSDKVFTNRLMISSRHQHLTLVNKPAFTDGERLQGIVRITTLPYFENRLEKKLDEVYLKGKIQFTCQVTK